jgi:hypothetical protein
MDLDVDVDVDKDTNMDLSTTSICEIPKTCLSDKLAVALPVYKPEVLW